MARARWEHEFGQLEAAQESGRLAVEIQTALSGTPTRSVPQSRRTSRRSAGPPGRRAARRRRAGRGRAADRRARTRATPGSRSAATTRCAAGSGSRAAVPRGPRGPRASARRWKRRTAGSASFRNATRVDAGHRAGRRRPRSTRRVSSPQTQLARARERGLHGHEARVLVASARARAGPRAGRSSCSKPPSPPRGAHPAGSSRPRRSLELGAALRRANRRADARDPLREARELALLAGAKGAGEARARRARDRGRAAAARRAERAGRAHAVRAPRGRAGGRGAAATARSPRSCS